MVECVQKSKIKFFNTRRLTLVAMLSAISILLYAVEFPLPFLPSFLKINFSDVPVLIGGIVLGLPGGCVIIIVRFLLKVPFTTTVAVGEFASVICSLAIMIPAVLIYNTRKNMITVIIGVVVGLVTEVVVAMLVNRLFLIDAYVHFYFKGDWEDFLNFMIRPWANNANKDNFYTIYLWVAVLPFNALQFGIVAIFSVLLHRPLQRASGKLFSSDDNNILDGLDNGDNCFGNECNVIEKQDYNSQDCNIIEEQDDATR